MKKLIASLGLLLITQANAAFSDNDQIPDWAQFPVKKLVEKNIVTGNSDGTFRPHDSVNRAEFCKILVNATGVKKYIPVSPSFSDVERDDWFFDYVETAKHHGWLAGYPDNSFRPGNKINRAETAKILTNAFGFTAQNTDKDTNWYDGFVRVLRNQKLFPHDANEETFDAGHFPSRAEIVEQIFRFMKKTGKFSSYDLQGEPTNEDASSSQTTPPTYNYVDNSPTSNTPVSANAGTLNISKKSGGLKKIQISSAQKNVKALQLYFNATNNPVEISGLQFRRIGNGRYGDFLKAWVDIDGKTVSSKILIDNDLINIPFKEKFQLAANAKKEVTLMIDASGTGEKENSSRFVLYLPEWISANTNKKIGFFPFGGIDLEIK